MVKEALKKSKLNKKNTKIYVIGDRMSDVHTAHNAKSFGIIVPFKNEPSQIAKVKKLNHKNTHVAKDFLDAAKFIIKKEKLKVNKK
jgi:histidinol phosphatase-like enzyme